MIFFSRNFSVRYNNLAYYACHLSCFVFLWWNTEQPWDLILFMKGIDLQSYLTIKIILSKTTNCLTFFLLVVVTRKIRSYLTTSTNPLFSIELVKFNIRVSHICKDYFDSIQFVWHKKKTCQEKIEMQICLDQVYQYK
jgi:hypothetical protein